MSAAGRNVDRDGPLAGLLQLWGSGTVVSDFRAAIS
jgi:hypothetical protein